MSHTTAWQVMCDDRRRAGPSWQHSLDPDAHSPLSSLFQRGSECDLPWRLPPRLRRRRRSRLRQRCTVTRCITFSPSSPERVCVRRPYAEAMAGSRREFESRACPRPVGRRRSSATLLDRRRSGTGVRVPPCVASSPSRHRTLHPGERATADDGAASAHSTQMAHLTHLTFSLQVNDGMPERRWRPR
jgi:hypothetical protein